MKAIFWNQRPQTSVLTLPVPSRSKVVCCGDCMIGSSVLEKAFLSSLANDMDLSVPRLLATLDQLDLRSNVTGRKGKQPSVSVPPSDLLSQLLKERGIDTKLLEPMQGIINSSWHAIKWLERPAVCENGNVRFCATWKGKLAPSFVCCHDLNASARAYVRALPPCLQI